MPTPPPHASPTQPTVLGDEAYRDVLAHGFWNCRKGTVFNVQICDTDSCSYSNTSSSKILENHAKEKKDKYETACLNHRRNFTPLVYFVDEMASKDTQTAKLRISWLIGKKWSRTYLDMASFIHTRMTLQLYDPIHSSSGATVPTHSADGPPQMALQPPP